MTLSALLLALASPLAHAQGAPDLGPVPLTLIWNVSPSPFSSYVSCADAENLDFCVSKTRWWGICYTEVDGQRQQRTLRPGEISLDARGEVSFTGCPTYEALIADSVAQANDFTTEKARFWTPLCEVDPSGRRAWGQVVGDTLVQPTTDATGTLTLRSWQASTAPTALQASTKDCAPIERFDAQGSERRYPIELGLADVPLQSDWRASLPGDLNGDGVPELVLHASVAGGYLHPNDAAVLVSAGETLVALAQTVPVPDIARYAPERRVVHDVQVALEGCWHWAGEEPYDEARARQIEEGYKASCAFYKEELRRALERYPGNPELWAMPREP